MIITDNKIDEYIDYHTSNEDKCLYELDRETNIKTTMPRMISGKTQGKFLEFLSLMIQPQRILEIGTFTGYSAICLAKGLTKDGKIITIESNEECKGIIEKYFQKSNFANKTKLVIGNALNEIPKLNEIFDLIFIDANKEEYIEYYNLAKTKLKSGGVILVDNVLWSGKVLNTTNPDKETIAIKNFNDYVKNDNSVEQVMINLRDGLLLIRKLA